MRWNDLGWAAALLLGAASLAAAQGAAKPEITDVAHIAIRTANQEAELGFLAKLGFEKAFAIERDGKVAFYFVKINDHEYIEVHPTLSPEGKTYPSGFDHICYESNDAKGLFAQWEKAGLKPTPSALGPDKTLEFGANDPEGRVAEALEVLPSSLQTPDKGKHMTLPRVSATMMGVDLPAKDVEASKRFFEAAGLTAVTKGKTAELKAKANPAILSVLRPADEGVQAQLLFSVASTAKAAKQLTALGLKFEPGKGRLIVRDPDGTAFVLVEKVRK